MRPSKPKTFKDLYTFVDIHRMPAAWDLADHVIQATLPDRDAIVGNAMVDRETYIPLGFACAYFEPDGIVSLQARLGGYLRQYPKDILASMAPVMKHVIDTGHEYLYAIADEQIEGSEDLVEWLGGVKTGERHNEPPVGDLYKIPTQGSRMQALVKVRGG